MPDDPLEAEWNAYRAACEEVDRIRDGMVRNPGSASAIEVANAAWEQATLARAYVRAVQTSEALIERADELGADEDWLHELRQHHARLEDAALQARGTGDDARAHWKKIRDDHAPTRRSLRWLRRG